MWPRFRKRGNSFPSFVPKERNESFNVAALSKARKSGGLPGGLGGPVRFNVAALSKARK